MSPIIYHFLTATSHLTQIKIEALQASISGGGFEETLYISFS